MENVSTVYILNNKNQLLMVYNKKQVAWLPPGGFVEDGELIHETAIRETKEEAGKSIGESLEFIGHVTFRTNILDERSKISPTPIFVVEQKLTNGKIVENFIYLAKANNDKIEEKSQSATWYDFEDVMKLDTFKNVRLQIQYIKENINKFSMFPKNEVKSIIEDRLI